ncbi:aminotransferase class V-fold PLP-dependent enzyme [Micromonospora sp. NPDC048894]|uniref:aminotransferase class V-fold PLP-dependent enzyme n=1 Tax=Micromonospora sp. NPDC048894 TaxID=3155493 RepID=UPI0033E6C47F
MTRPPTALRSRLPELAHTVHLAACSISPRSLDLDNALATMLDDLARPGFWTACEEKVLQARQRFAALIGADVDQIAVVPNVRSAAHQAISGRRWRWKRTLLSSTAEFPGVAHAWLAAQQRGARVHWCGTDTGEVTTADYLHGITSRTALVSVPAVTYRDGIRLDVARIAEAAHAAGANVFVDDYQAAGVLPVNVDAMGCDYLAGGTGKYLLGLPGMAFLYVRHPCRQPASTLTGWLGRVHPSTISPDFPPHASRLGTGTPAAAAAYAAVAGMSLIADLDLDAVRQQTQRLLTHATDRLEQMGETVRVPAEPDERGAHLALMEPHAENLGTWLGRRGITVAPRGNVVRIAVHAYSTVDDINALCEAIGTYRTRFTPRAHAGDCDDQS